jgi:DNA-binding Lrp family transcriptional regulator
MSHSEIDALDARLLETMRTHPRVGLTELARLLGVARGTVQARLDKLVAREIIADFGPTVRPARMGYPVLAFLSLQIAQGLVAEAVRHLETLAEVLEVHGTSGSSDLLCRVAARSNDYLQEIIATVLTSPAVQRSDTSVVLSTQIPYRVEPLIRAAPRQARTQPNPDR